MYVSQLPQTPWPGLTVPPLQLHTSFSCLESDLWELFSWAPPLQASRKASPCSMHSQLHPAGSGPGLSLTCLPALLWSWLFLLGPDPCASPGAKVTPQRRPSRDTCYNGSNRVCRFNPTPNSCSPQTLHLLSVLLMHSLLEIGKWSLEPLLRARKVLNFRFFSVGDILEMGPKSKHKIHLCLVQICRLAVILYIYYFQCICILTVAYLMRWGVEFSTWGCPICAQNVSEFGAFRISDLQIVVSVFTFQG